MLTYKYDLLKTLEIDLWVGKSGLHVWYVQTRIDEETHLARVVGYEDLAECLFRHSNQLSANIEQIPTILIIASGHKEFFNRCVSGNIHLNDIV